MQRAHPSRFPVWFLSHIAWLLLALLTTTSLCAWFGLALVWIPGLSWRLSFDAAFLLWPLVSLPLLLMWQYQLIADVRRRLGLSSVPRIISLVREASPMAA